MIDYEVAAENGTRVRVSAADELDAVEQAGEMDPDIWYAGAYPTEDRPIGWDGGDAHEALDEFESLENGDMK